MAETRTPAVLPCTRHPLPRLDRPGVPLALATGQVKGNPGSPGSTGLDGAAGGGYGQPQHPITVALRHVYDVASPNLLMGEWLYVVRLIDLRRKGGHPWAYLARRTRNPFYSRLIARCVRFHPLVAFCKKRDGRSLCLGCAECARYQIAMERLLYSRDAR